jgi:amidase
MDYWNNVATPTGRPVDAVLTPVAPYAALPLGKHYGTMGKSSDEAGINEQMLNALAYTPWVNALDYTAVVIPVSKVDENVDKFEANYQPLSEVDRIIREECK